MRVCMCVHSCMCIWINNTHTNLPPWLLYYRSCVTYCISNCTQTQLHCLLCYCWDIVDCSTHSLSFTHTHRHTGHLSTLIHNLCLKCRARVKDYNKLWWSNNAGILIPVERPIVSTPEYLTRRRTGGQEDCGYGRRTRKFEDEKRSGQWDRIGEGEEKKICNEGGRVERIALLTDGEKGDV